MICYTDKLDTAINTGCPTTFGMERNGYLCLRCDINPKTESGLVVDFVPRFMIPIYQPSENAYKPKSEGEKNAYGLTKFQKSIEVFLIANTELSQEQIMWLKDEDWVAVLKQRDETVIVFGFERGLRLKTTSQDLNSTETHGGILLTFDENQVNSPMLFGSETLYDWQDYDLIYGGSSGTTATVKLTVDNDKTGYIKLPNGTVLATTAGVIDTTYSGVAGEITRYVPKNNVGYISMVGSTTLGDITYTGNKRIEFSVIAGITGFTSNTVDRVVGIGCTHLAKAVLPKSYYINLSGCILTAKSIGDILYSAHVDNRASVVFNFSGGTNANETAIAAYMLSTYNLDLSNVLEDLTSGLGGIITLNT